MRVQGAVIRNWFFPLILTIFPPLGAVHGGTFLVALLLNMATTTASTKFPGAGNQDLAPGTMNGRWNDWGFSLPPTYSLLSTGAPTGHLAKRDMLLTPAAPSHNAEHLKGIKHLVISKQEDKYFQGRLKARRLGMHADDSPSEERAKRIRCARS